MMNSGQLPIVTKYIIVLCIILFTGTWILSQQGIINLEIFFALFYIQSEHFRPHQFVSHIFMHGDIAHIFFNMFGLFMFGRILESIWGPKRFLTFFLVTGIGAGLIHMAVLQFENTRLTERVNLYTSQTPTPDSFYTFLNETFGDYMARETTIKNPATRENYTIRELMAKDITEWKKHPELNTEYQQQALATIDQFYTSKLNTPTVGASGAIFGILMAFGMLFPNMELIMLFLPIPIKAKYAVILYAGIELFLGVANFTWDNVAHFAHLGGALFGFILVKLWNKDRKHFY